MTPCGDAEVPCTSTNTLIQPWMMILLGLVWELTRSEIFVQYFQNKEIFLGSTASKRGRNVP